MYLLPLDSRAHEDLQSALERHQKLCNEHRPQRALAHRAPLQAIRTWQAARSGLATEKRNNQAGSDSL